MQVDTFVNSDGEVSMLISADTPLDEEILKKVAKQVTTGSSIMIEVTSAITIFNKNSKGLLIGKKNGNGVIGKQEDNNKEEKK